MKGLQRSVIGYGMYMTDLLLPRKQRSMASHSDMFGSTRVKQSIPAAWIVGWGPGCLHAVPPSKGPGQKA